MTKRAVSNPLALAVMAWLLTGPMHPYELGKRLKETGKDRNIKYNRGSLYMVVGQLHRAGLVTEQGTLRDTLRPERTVYALTEAGRAEVYAWLGEWLAKPQHEYPQFGVALSLLSIIAPGDAAGLLAQRREAMSHEMAQIEAMIDRATGDDVPWIFMIEEDYRLVLLKAEHDFIGRLIEALDRPDYLQTWSNWSRSWHGGAKATP